jgi:hypothetical protein
MILKGKIMDSDPVIGAVMNEKNHESIEIKLQNELTEETV